MSESLVFSQVFNELSGPTGASAATVRRVFDGIFAGAWTPAQISGFLVGLRLSGDRAEVISAAAEAMRAAMIPIEHDFDALLDTCGTGGDGSHTLNLSTGAAIIAAAAGVRVAKHGNRAATSKSGSADVLESLGIRTLFNCLGPLANPARVTHQLLGAYDDSIRPILADALRALGTRRAWVVRSRDGMDEVSPHAPTRVTVLSSGKLEEIEIAPEDFGLPRLPEGAIHGAEPASNAAVLQAVLAGEPHPSRDAFVLNAAAALCVALELPPRVAADRARQALDSGAARTTLERWRSAATARRPPATG